jgi:UTP:GlnB (protein PII) uridylyltransferase
VIAQDQPGLLHRISTEGQTVIDVFYITSGEAKVKPEHQERLRKALLEELPSK